MTRGVFISYCSQDREFAQRLVRDIKDRDIPVWFDEAELEPGDSIIQKIEAGIDRMDYLIVIMSPASVDSRWVQEEVRMALQKGIAGRKFTVIPILKADCDILGFLRDRKYVDMRPAADYPAGLEKIVNKIRGSLEFKDSLQKFQDDLQGLKAHKAELTRELGTEKVRDIEDAGSLAERAIRGEISDKEWTQAAEHLRASLGIGDVTFDQHSQRIKHQTNIGSLTVNLPIAPTQTDPETLIEYEAAFLQRVRKRFSEEELSGLQRVEIQPLSDEQIQDFLQRELRQTWQDLWQELTEDGDSLRSLLKLARNPYMLTVMIDVFEEDGRLGRNRAELVHRFTEILTGWAKKKCPAHGWVDADVQREALAAMAFEIQDREGFGTLVKTVQAKAVMPEKVQPDPNWPSVPSPPDRELDLAASAHIIEMTGDKSSLRFYHQLLQEYYAAREMLKRNPDGLEKM